MDSPSSASVEHVAHATGVLSGSIAALLVIALVARAEAQTVKEQVAIATMKSDLRNFVTAEEAFFGDNVRYAQGGELARSGKLTPSPGVTDLRVFVSGSDFGASVGYVGTDTYCAIFLGKTPIPPATKEGEPKCTGSALDATAGPPEQPMIGVSEPLPRPTAVPVSVAYRKSLVGQGLVVQIKNSDTEALSVSAKFTNPATGENRVFKFALSPGGMKEFGYMEGWTFAPGHTVEVSSVGYGSWSATVPSNP